jgi:hypothetical protein
LTIVGRNFYLASVTKPLFIRGTKNLGTMGLKFVWSKKMNMISTGAFQNEMDASNKQPSVAEKFAAVWEKKNAKAARAGGVSLMALSLAACGSSSTTTSSTTTTTTTTTTSTAADTIALTAGVDTASGGAGDTTINALTEGHLEASDTITGGAGSDTLVIRDYDSNAGTFTMSGVETIDINFATATTLDLEDVTGLTSIIVDSSSGGAATIANAEAAHSVTLANIASGGVTTVNVDFEDGQFDGTNTYAIALNDVDDDLSLSLDTYGTNVEAIETLTIDTGANANGGTVTLTTEGANAETVTITGSAAAKLSGFTSGTVNASGASGALTLTMGAEEQTITGGSGNDVIVMAGNLTYEDTIDGGDGTDTLSISTASGVVLSNASTGNVANVSNIETLTLSAQLTAATSIDMSKISGLTRINFADINDASTANDHVTITKAPDNVTISVADSSADTLAADIIVNFASNTATNNLTLLLEDVSTPDLVNTDGYADALTITSTGTNILSVVGYQADSLTITGTGSTDLTSASTDALNAATSTLDASASTGVVKAIASATGTEMTGGSAGDTLTGGTGADVIAGGAGNDTMDGNGGNDTITGGAGADTITGGTGANTLTGGAGVDKFVIEATTEDHTITDFTAGTAGDDIEFADDLLNQAAAVVETGAQVVQVGAKSLATNATTTIRVVTDADLLTVAADSTFADIETDLDNLIGSGDTFLTMTSGATSDIIGLVLDGNDGNSYVFMVDNDASGGATSIQTTDSITLVAVLQGVDTADIVAANFIA